MKKTYIIKLEKEEWKECLDKAFDKRKKEVNIPGFRKGKVSWDTYIRQFGIESLYMDAADIALPIAFDKLIKEEKPDLAASPAADIKDINADYIEVEFTCVGKPTVKLGKYKNLGIKKEKVTVKKEEVDHELDNLKAKYVELKTVTRKIKKGDIAVIDFEGFKDGVPFEGGKGDSYSLEIGSNSFIPGFEDALIGLKGGEEKDVNLTFPKDYPAVELQGKDVVFKVKVLEVQEKIEPKLGKEFFEDLAMEGIDTEEKLREEIKKNIKVNKEREADTKFIDELLQKITENSKFELPDEMINEEIERMIKEFSQQLQMQGFELDKYLEMIRTDIDGLKEQMKPEASARVSYRLILEQIVKDEKITATEKEVDEEADRLAKRYQMEREDFLKAFGGIEFVKYDIEVRRALELIQKENK